MATPLSSASLLQLLCFVRVVEAGSFAEAARRLGMSTSAVSKTIARFETAHRLRLLHRSTHSLSMTEEGERLLDEARETLRGFERLETSLADIAGGSRTGRVRISAPTAFVRACLAPCLPRLLAAHPDISLDLRSSDRLVDLAEEGVDIALRAGSVDRTAGHVCLPLFSFPWTACATPAYLASRGVPSKPDDLADHDLIGFRNGSTGKLDAWRFRSEAVNHAGPAISSYLPASRLVFDDALSAWAMAQAGLGIAWAPGWIAAPDLQSGRMVEVLQPWRCSDMPMSILRRERRLTPERTEFVIAFLKSVSSEWCV